MNILWRILCLFGCHAWSIVDPNDWRTDNPLAWGMAGGARYVIGGPRVRVTCDHCGKRDYANFQQLTGDEAWRRGVEPEWHLAVGGCPIQGGPPSELVERCFYGHGPVWDGVDPFGVPA